MAIFARSARIFICLVFLVSCGGSSNDRATPGSFGGPNPAPDTTQTAIATLAPGARLLTDQENAQIAQETATSVTFNGTISLAPGSVFITNYSAYKVVAVIPGTQTTVVSVMAPAIEDVFATLDISGQFSVTNDMEAAEPEQQSALATREIQSATTAAQVGSTTISSNVHFQEGALKGSHATTTTLAVSVDYHFDRATGGLTNASMAAEADINGVSQLTLEKNAKVADKFFGIKRFFIPIRLTIADALLGVLGVRVAGISVPIGLRLTADTGFKAGVTVNSAIKSRASFAYTNGALSTDGDTSGTGDIHLSDIGIDVGDVGVTTNVGAYLNIRPALSVLNTVALAGIDLRAGPRADLSGRLVQNRVPNYCISATGSLRGAASAFFKTIGVDKTSDAITTSKEIFKGPLLGSCLPDSTTEITGISAPSTPPVFGETIDVDVRVRAVALPSAPGKIPAGTVSVEMGNEKCIATLQLDGTGRCPIKAGAAGTGLTLRAEYNGGVDLATSSTTANLDVRRSPTSASIAATPPVLATGATVTLNSVLSPKPDRAQNPLPTGSVTFASSTGATICTATVDSAGTAQCSGIVSGTGRLIIVGNYSGDSNYEAVRTADATVTFATAQPLCSSVIESIFLERLTVQNGGGFCNLTDSVLIVDFDGSYEQFPIERVLVTPPLYGNLSLTPPRYTPDPNYVGPDKFVVVESYNAIGGGARTVVYEVTVTPRQ